MENRKLFYLDSYTYQEIIDQHKNLTVLEKMKKFLNALGSLTLHPGHVLKIKPAKDYPLAHCQNQDELKFYLEELLAEGLISDSKDRSGGGYGYGSGDGAGNLPSPRAERREMEIWEIILTSKAWERLQGSGININSNVVFLVRWFPGEDDDTNDCENMKAYLKAVSEVIKDSGFDLDGDLEGGINEKICDRIMAKIRQARFIIADTTFPEKKGYRANIYYEAGFAYGLNLPIIWTCRKDHLDNKKLPFDTRQYPHIDWTPDNMQDFKNELKDKIIANLGRGTKT
ncbi:hypothetical protein K8S19_10605 [bacterium]|nr:hypothetical protein [bacterium]